MGGMAEEQEVHRAAQQRADALVSGDPQQLRSILHPKFVWTSHKGDVFDRESYIQSNVGGVLTWKSQRLEGLNVRLVGATAVLTGTVVDEVERGGQSQLFEMLVTQVWVKRGDKWLCLAGHAGPPSGV